MKMLDTGSILDFLRKTEGAEKLKNIFIGETVFVSRISYFEILSGIFHIKDGFQRDARMAEAMDFFGRVEILELDEKSAILAAEISGKLNKEGHIIEPNDCLIAGTALSNGIKTIVTKNAKDFQKIDGLRVDSY